MSFCAFLQSFLRKPLDKGTELCYNGRNRIKTKAMTKTVQVGHAQRVGGWCKPTLFPLQTHHFRAGAFERFAFPCAL